jgi:hypothetical protein
MGLRAAFSLCCLVSAVVACGDDANNGGSGGSNGGGTPEGGQAQGGTAEGGGGEGGTAACVPSGSGSGDDVNCQDICDEIATANCGPTVDQCLAGCAALQGDCPGFDNFIDCAGAVPEWTCDGENLVPANPDCTDEWFVCAQPCLPQG